jgi:membrane protein
MIKLAVAIRKSSPVRMLSDLSKRIVLPGFDGLPLYDVGDFFIRGMKHGALNTRAMAMSFSFLLAIFPSIIFLFTLIPYIPIDDFQDELLLMIKDFLPKSNYETIRETVEDIIKHQRGGLLSVGFFSALYFSTNGINAMMESFNQTYHSIETRSAFRQRMISMLLTIILFVLIVAAVTLLIFSESGLQYLVKIHWLKKKSTLLWLLVGKWTVIVLMFFSAFSFLFYFGPAKQKRFRFISAGSILATILSVIVTIGLGYFVNNIVSYNKLYGSIGTLIIIMLWININAFILLICFELNASIDNASEVYHKKNLRKTLKNVFKSSL